MRSVPERRPGARPAAVTGLAAYAAAVALGVACTASGVEAFLAAIFDAPVRPAATRPVQTNNDGSMRIAALVPTQDAWHEMVRDPAYWTSRKSGGGKPWASGWFSKPQPSRAERASGSVFAAPRLDRDDGADTGQQTYRTVCVRLCDGAFTPLSFATTRDNFDKDAAKCERSCGADSRMYFYKNPGADADDMEDLNGRPYKSLGTAFLYKTKYVEQCKCRPHPWEEAAVDRHKVYALEAARANGSKVAAASLKSLQAKMRQAELAAEAAKPRVAEAKVGTQKRLAAETKAGKAAARIASPAKATVAVAIAIAPQPRPGSLPPPSSPEPTATYQPPARSQPQQSRSPAVILRAGTKSTRVLPQPAWKPQQDVR